MGGALVKGDWRELLTLFPAPETDVTCTATLATQLNIDVCGAGPWGKKVGRKGSAG